MKDEKGELPDVKERRKGHDGAGAKNARQHNK